MKSNQGIVSIAIIVIVLLLLAAGGGVYLWQQTKLPVIEPQPTTPTPPVPPAPEVVATTTDIDTTGWKTYRNEEHGFEFRYPADYNTYIASDDYIEIARPEVKSGKEVGAFFNISVKKQPCTYKGAVYSTVVDYLENCLERILLTPSITDKHEVDVGSINAVRLKGTYEEARDGGTGVFEGLYAMKDGIVYAFKCMGLCGVSDEIFSTFRFIK